MSSVLELCVDGPQEVTGLAVRTETRLEGSSSSSNASGPQWRHDPMGSASSSSCSSGEPMSACDRPGLGGRSEEGAGCRRLPQKAIQVASGVVEDLELTMTPFTRRCAALWLELRGRRFNVYVKRPPGQARVRQRRQVRGTDVAVTRGVAQSASALVRAATSGTAPCPEHHKTVLGVPRSQLKARGVDAAANKNKKQTLFHKATLRKKAAQVVQAACRRRGENPYPLPSLRLGRVFKGPEKQQALLPIGERGTPLKVLDATSEGVAPSGSGCRVDRLGSADAVFHAVRRCDAVILDSCGLLDSAVVGWPSACTTDCAPHKAFRNAVGRCRFAGQGAATAQLSCNCGLPVFVLVIAC